MLCGERSSCEPKLFTATDRGFRPEKLRAHWLRLVTYHVSPVTVT